MKYKVFLFAFALTLALSADAQTRPDDVLGWLDARWGMSAEELRKTFGASLEQVPKGDYFVRPDDTKYGYTGFIIKDFALVDGRFTVKLILDINTDHLTEIYITPASDSAYGFLFNKLDAALRQKYGQPDYKTEDSESFAKGRKWFFQTTTIELLHVQSQGYSSLRLTYEPSKKEKL